MEEVLDGIIKIFKDSQRTKLPSPNCSSVYYAINILYSNVRRKKKTEKEWMKGSVQPRACQLLLQAGSVRQRPRERKWKPGSMAVPALFLSSELGSLI